MSDLRVEFYENFEDFYAQIPEGAEENSLNTPFQYKDWQEKLYAEHQAVRPKMPYLGAVLFQSDKPIVGGHFFVKKSGRQRGVFFLGGGGETDYFDLIYFCSEVQSEHIDELLRQTAQYGQSDQLTFAQVPEESPLADWAHQKGFEPHFVNECAWIHLEGSYEEYLATLSKSVRQNIRTANNRLNKDNFTSSIQIYNEQSISMSEIHELLSLYEARKETKSHLTGLAGIKHRIHEIIRKNRKKKYNLMAEAMCCMNGKFLAIYRINEEVAAYCFGLKNRYADSICVMQVAINDDYGKYSPGMLMLTAVFQNFLGTENGRKLIFDLTNGNEKYKYSLGATSHYTNYYKISLPR